LTAPRAKPIGFFARCGALEISLDARTLMRLDLVSA